MSTTCRHIDNTKTMQYPSPPDQRVYFQQLWDLARQVPFGKASTYGQLAQMIGCPTGIDEKDYASLGSPWVGNAMAACPDDVPWHRVINSQGKISTRPGAQGQQLRLQREGIVFERGRIDLKVYQWRTAEQADEPTQGDLF